MQTNFPEITSSDLKAALDFLTGERSEANPPPTKVRRPSNTVKPVVAVHNGINRERIRPAKATD